MFRRFKAALDSLRELPSAVEGLQLVVQDGFSRLEGVDELRNRLAEVEGAVHTLLAEAEAQVTRAESMLKAARGAEERARGMERRARKYSGAGDDDEEEPDPFASYVEALQGANAPNGPGAGVPAVHQGVAPLSGKDAARARKWGGVNG